MENRTVQLQALAIFVLDDKIASRFYITSRKRDSKIDILNKWSHGR
jgi:hypothetical protein